MKTVKYLTVAVLCVSLICAAANVFAAGRKKGGDAPAKNSAPAAKKKTAPTKMTALKVLDEIQKRFIARKIRTMTYDEVRTTSYEFSSGKQRGMMSISPDNATTIRLRYFYMAPDRHGYRFLSDAPENYWAGSPNQPGAIPMDEKWRDKVLSEYRIYLQNMDKCGGRVCYVLVLVPLKGASDELYPMTWYIDTKDFLVRKFILLIRDKDGRYIRSTGEMDYGKVNGVVMPVKSNWRTNVSELPYVFILRITMENYNFNVPLDNSVFEEEYPKNWFEMLGQPEPKKK
jgi:hypothetical protein